MPRRLQRLVPRGRRHQVTAVGLAFAWLALCAAIPLGLWLFQPPMHAPLMLWAAAASGLALPGLVLVVWVHERWHRRALGEQDARLAGLRQTEQALRQALARGDDLVATVGHELRTPMTAILGFNDVLREELAGQPESLEAVEQIHQSTLLLLQRVNEALDAARLQAGAPALPEEVRESDESHARARGQGSRLARDPLATDGPGQVAPIDKPLQILLVDDNPVNLMVAQRQLLKACPQARVFTAGSGEDALRMLAQQPFDLALLDVQMPGMDGLALTRQLRARPLDAAVRMPILALTANTDPADHARCLAAGMDEVLCKPIAVDALARVVGRLVGRGAP